MMSPTSSYKFVSEEFLLQQLFGYKLQLNIIKFFNNHLERTNVYINEEQLINKKNLNRLSEYVVLKQSNLESFVILKIIGAEKKEISPAKPLFIDLFSTKSMLIMHYRLLIDHNILYNYEDCILANCKIGVIETMSPIDKTLNHAYINEKLYIQKNNMILYSIDKMPL